MRKLIPVPLAAFLLFIIASFVFAEENSQNQPQQNAAAVSSEVAPSIKNVIAIAAGISDGLGFGCNTRAALITRGLAEMTRLGLTMGARSSTFAGLAGMLANLKQFY